MTLTDTMIIENISLSFFGLKIDPNRKLQSFAIFNLTVSD